jgi:hydrogenase maturation protein HypF
VPLPGGDAANREPWRNALARLDASGLATLADTLFPDRPLEHPPPCHGGRDQRAAVLLRRAAFRRFAAVLGFDGPQSFEGEAAMGLEALAAAAPKPRRSSPTVSALQTAE